MSARGEGAVTRTNRELAAEAKALGDELGVRVELAGLNKAGLLELIEKLRAQRVARLATAEASDPAATPSPAPVVHRPSPPPVPARPAAPSYRVARRRAVSTLARGIRGPGDEVSAADFPGGAERLAELERAGVLVRR